MKFFGVDFKNPIIPASGCFGFGKEFSEIYDLNILGGICTKSITLDRRLGNETPRIAECGSYGMLNSIGLQNNGVDHIIKYELEFLKKFNTPIIANIAGSDESDYMEVIKKLNEVDVIKIYELNISCPNVKCGGMAFGVDPDMVYKITKICKDASNKPLIVKLSPNVTDIVTIAKSACDGGADGLTLINTLLGMRFDIHSAKPILANKIGGYSGIGIKPIALRCVYEVAKNVDVPIIGVGGISNVLDVIEFLYAGASLVQIGSYNFVDPFICKKIIDELDNKFDELNITWSSAIKRGVNE